MDQPSKATQSLLTRYAQGVREMPGIDLAGQALADCELEGVLMPGAKFAGATLSNVTLVLGHLFGSDFRAATFENCALLLTQFQGSSFFGAKFKNCVIGSYFNEAFLGAVKFENCVFISSSFDDATLVGSEFISSNLDGFTTKGVVEKSKKFLGSIPEAEQLKSLALTERSQMRNFVDQASLDATIALLGVRRKMIADQQSTSLAEGKRSSGRKWDRLSTLSSLENFLQNTTLSRPEVDRFMRDYKNAAGVPGVFISYSFQDGDAFAQAMEQHISRLGCPVWFAPQKMRGGNTIADQLHQGVAEAEIFLIVVSKNSLKSEWVHREILAFHRLAQRDDKRKFDPVRIDATTLDGFSLIDPETGQDIGAELGALKLRDFSAWREPERLATEFDVLATDLGLTSASAGMREHEADQAPEKLAQSVIISAGHETKAAGGLHEERVGATLKNVVYLSYSSDDLTFAEMVERRLLAKGQPIGVWPLQDALLTAKAMLAVLSARSLQSETVRNEILTYYRLAVRDHTRKMHLVRIDDAVITNFSLVDPETGEDIGKELSLHYMRDFSGWRDRVAFSLAFDALAADLQLAPEAEKEGRWRAADRFSKERILAEELEREPDGSTDAMTSSDSSAARKLEAALEFKRLIREGEGQGKDTVAWYETMERAVAALSEEDFPDRDKMLRETTANKQMKQGMELEEAGRFDEAIVHYKQAEQVYRQHGLESALKFSLKCQVSALGLKRAALSREDES